MDSFGELNFFLYYQQAPAGSRIFNPKILQTPGIPGFFGTGLAWNFFSRDFTKKVWVWANLSNYMSPDGGFRYCHLAFGKMGKMLWISKNQDYIRYEILISLNSWTWWEHCALREEDSLYFSFSKFVKTMWSSFLDIRENPENWPFFVRYFFVFHSGIYIGRWDLPKTSLDLVNLGPQSTVCNLHPPIYGVTTLCWISIPR